MGSGIIPQVILENSPSAAFQFVALVSIAHIVTLEVKMVVFSFVMNPEAPVESTPKVAVFVEFSSASLDIGVQGCNGNLSGEHPFLGAGP